MGKIPKKRKPFKKYHFRLSGKQSKSLQNYCLISKISPNKLIKSVLKSYIENYTDEKIGNVKTDSKQLNLFHEEAPEYKQMRIFPD